MMRTIASNTGFTSSGERAMTLRISAVAAWRRRASLSSRASPWALALGLVPAPAARARSVAAPLPPLLARLGMARRFGALLLARRPLLFELPFLGPRAMSALPG